MQSRMTAQAAAVLATALVLSAGSNPAEEAERAESQYHMAEENSLFDPRGACEAAGKAKRAWLEVGDREKYEHWSMMETTSCYRR